MIILVTGANGQVGRSFRKIADQYDDVTWHFADSKELDITIENAVTNLVDSICPDYIVNCAAYTAVDKAETEPDKAFLINETAVGYLAMAAKESGSTLIHYSSDYVYHNDQTIPIKETDTTFPKGVYAKSKLAGEQKIVGIGPKAIIIRTSWIYSEFGNNFVKTMLRLGAERDTLSVVDDQIGCPTYATDIAEDTMKMMKEYPYLPDHQIIVNYTGDGQISWFDFASEIFKNADRTLELHPIPSSSYPTPAVRPLNSVLDLSYVQEIFNIKIKSWQKSFESCLHRMS